jgi:hypothetical protein
MWSAQSLAPQTRRWKLELQRVHPNQFRNSVQPSRTRHQGRNSRPTRRVTCIYPEEAPRVSFLALDGNALKSRMTVTQAEISQAVRKDRTRRCFRSRSRSAEAYILLKTEG